MSDRDLVTEQSAAETRAEDAAFLKAFDAERGGQESAPEIYTPPAEPSTEVEPGAVVETPPAAAAVEPGAAVETPAVETPPALFAGLTEAQLQSALSRSGALQTTVDKMAGRIGQLMQQIEALRTTPPTTQAAQVALDLKLEKLSAAFPDMAAMLREDLKSMQAGSAAAAPLAPTVPAGVTQAELDSLLTTRLGQVQAATDEKIETRVLSILHPDWLDQVKSDKFALWRDNVLGTEAGKALMTSEDSAFIAKNLTDFKAWVASTEGGQLDLQPPPQPAPAAAPVVAPKRTTRLANAVLPAGSAQTPPTVEMTEEDGFLSGFNKERAARGYA